MVVKYLALLLIGADLSQTVQGRTKYRPRIEEYLTRHENRSDNVFTQMKEDMRAHKASHPFVKSSSTLRASYNQSCTWAVDRMGNGPIDWSNYQASASEKWVDEDFQGLSTIYWSEFSTSYSAQIYNSLVTQGYTFDNWSKTFPSSSIWVDGQVDFNDIVQGNIGSCYILASMSALGEWEKTIKDIFLNTQKQDSGIIPIKFYIRGKPWIMTIDEQLFTRSTGSLFFAARSPNDQSMWAPLIEKAYAKMNGNYEFINGGFVENGLRTFVGAPVFTYDGYYMSASDEDTYHNLFKAADAAHYVMGAAVYSSDIGGDTNSCGIFVGHAYAIIAAFIITEASGTTHKVLMVRNPWGVTFYNKEWSYSDTRWTDDIVTNQVPNGVDPRTSNQQGIFIMPIKYLVGGQCISSIQIGHTRESEGYKYTWYDEEELGLVSSAGIAWQDFTYTVTLPRQDGDLYFSAETFQQVHVPLSCYDSSLSYYGYPVLWFEVTNTRTGINKYQYYAETWNKPIMWSQNDYQGGDTFTIYIGYDFDGSPNRDFTVSMYSKMSEDSGVWIYDSNSYANQLHMDGTEPSGFFKSTYRNGQSKPLPNESIRDKRKREREENNNNNNNNDNSNTDNNNNNNNNNNDQNNNNNNQDNSNNNNNNDGGHNNNTNNNHTNNHTNDHSAYDDAAEQQRLNELDPFHKDYIFKADMPISSLRDVFIYSRNNQEFDKLYWNNPWTAWYWFNETATETAEYDNTPKEENIFMKMIGL